MGAGPLISVVDDDAGIRFSLDGLLRSAGYHARMFASAEDALASPGIERSDCVISDLQMSHADGLELARQLRARNSQLPIMIITAYPTAEAERRADKQGVFFMSKPFEAHELLEMIDRMLIPSSVDGR